MLNFLFTNSIQIILIVATGLIMIGLLFLLYKIIIMGNPYKDKNHTR